MELRQLRYFIAVAEELHFSRAAVRLHIAQPALSHQIKQLEAELHAPLFWRTKRHVELTEAGQAFLEEARKTLVQAEQAARVAAVASAQGTELVRVAFIDSALYGFIPQLLRAFRTRRPEARFALQELTSGQQVEALNRSELQLGVLRRARAGPPLAFHEIGRERLLVAMPTGHSLSAMPEVPIDKLEPEDWILFPREVSPGLHDYLGGICRRAGFTPRIVQVGHQGHTIVGLVGAGLGIAVVPENLRHWGGPAVVYRPLKADSPWLPMYLAWRRDERSPTVRSFIEIATSKTNWGLRRVGFQTGFE